jgi:glycosyltransferase involved in cell wall biosynthesis
MLEDLGEDLQNQLPITVLVQTKNEEHGIEKCLSALAAFSEIIVVDSNSTDRTSEIARSAGATVVDFTWNGKYPKKKQWQLENVETKHSWVLFIDADEYPTAELIAEMRNRLDELNQIKFAAYDVPLEYVFSGKALKYGHRVVKRCLVQKALCRFPEIDDLEAPGMGELEGHYQPVASGQVGRFSSRLLHDDQDPIRTWFDRHNRYSDWEAYLRTNPKVKSAAAKRRSLQGRIFDAVPFKPGAFFVFAYIAKAGFLDGRPGFDYAFALSAYYWQIGLKVREAKRFTDALSETSDSRGGPIAEASGV